MWIGRGAIIRAMRFVSRSLRFSFAFCQRRLDGRGCQVEMEISGMVSNPERGGWGLVVAGVLPEVGGW